jgi:hypothetical protein
MKLIRENFKNNECKYTIKMRVNHTYRIQQMKGFCLQIAIACMLNMIMIHLQYFSLKPTCQQNHKLGDASYLIHIPIGLLINMGSSGIIP